MTTKQTHDPANEQRRRAVIALLASSAALIDQHRAARAAIERGEPLVPGKQVIAEAKARRQRA